MWIDQLAYKATTRKFVSPSIKSRIWKRPLTFCGHIIIDLNWSYRFILVKYLFGLYYMQIKKSPHIMFAVAVEKTNNKDAKPSKNIPFCVRSSVNNKLKIHVTRHVMTRMNRVPQLVNCWRAIRTCDTPCYQHETPFNRRKEDLPCQCLWYVTVVVCRKIGTMAACWARSSSRSMHRSPAGQTLTRATVSPPARQVRKHMIISHDIIYNHVTGILLQKGNINLCANSHD